MNFKLSLETVYGVLNAAYEVIPIYRDQSFIVNLLNDLWNIKKER